MPIEEAETSEVQENDMSPAPYAPTSAEPRQGLAITALVLGILSVLTFGCLGVGALTGLILGIVALMRANRQPDVYGGKGLAIGGIVTSLVGLAGAALLAVLIILPLIGMTSAIAIPSLLKARVSANEAAAIGDIRTMISAQAAYQSANGGYYEGRLACLNVPTDGCIPQYTAAAPTFLDSQLASLTPKSGYTRRFEVAPPATSIDPSVSSPTSVGSFAYVAVPIQPGQTGVRGFCGDASGIICFTPDGSAPQVSDGACDLSSCSILQ